jgi:adenine-specific DNA-methyltransferase
MIIAHSVAKPMSGESLYLRKSDELRGFVFEPLRAYLDGERERAGATIPAVRERVGHAGNGSVYGWFRPHDWWCLPTAEEYAKLQAAYPGFFLRPYQLLLGEFESLRRPFAVTADVPYTDVWTFPTVPHRKGKHVCEKPAELVRHVVRASSRPGALVLDCFAGSGVTGEVCRDEGRECVLIERDAAYCANIRRRLEGLPELPRVVSPAASSRKVTRRASAGAWLFPELEDVPA